MATATESLNEVGADPLLLGAIIDGVNGCMTMCETEVKCVGVSTVPTHNPGCVTGLIGVHGNVSGFVTINLAEKAAMSMVSGLLQEPCDTLTNQVIDGVGEIANIVSGGIKKSLAGSDWGFMQVTVPSVIVAQHYEIAYVKGLNYLSATFEQQKTDSVMLSDRLIQVAISLIRL